MNPRRPRGASWGVPGTACVLSAPGGAQRPRSVWKDPLLSTRRSGTRSLLPRCGSPDRPACLSERGRRSLRNPGLRPPLRGATAHSALVFRLHGGAKPRAPWELHLRCCSSPAVPGAVPLGCWHPPWQRTLTPGALVAGVFAVFCCVPSLLKVGEAKLWCLVGEVYSMHFRLTILSQRMGLIGCNPIVRRASICVDFGVQVANLNTDVLSYSGLTTRLLMIL